MQGQEVYPLSDDHEPYAVGKVLEKAGLTVDDIDYIVRIRPNDRILLSAAKKLGIAPEKMDLSSGGSGNTSSSSIPSALTARSGKDVSPEYRSLY
jgi:3-oxoacyl-[acyl-carrier-protein] synthase-3